MSEATERPWGVSVLTGHVTGDRDEGAMIVSPPPEESRRRIREGKMPFTSRRIALLEASPYTPHSVCEANAALIVEAVNAHDALMAACNAHAALVAACKAFAAAMRKGDRPEMLDLVKALHMTDAALAAARQQ